MQSFKQYLKENSLDENISSKATNKYIGMDKSKLKDLLKNFQSQHDDSVRKKMTFGGKHHDEEIAQYETLVRKVQHALKRAK